MADRHEPRCTLIVEVTGQDYDEVVRDAHSKAVDFLGVGRDYWLSIEGVGPDLSTTDGQVIGWRGDARIAYPTDPVF